MINDHHYHIQKGNLAIYFLKKKKNVLLQNKLLLIDILKDSNLSSSNFLYINIAFCSDNSFFFPSIRSNFFKFYYLKENNCIFDRYKFYLIILFSYLYIKYVFLI